MALVSIGFLSLPFFLKVGDKEFPFCPPTGGGRQKPSQVLAGAPVSGGGLDEPLSVAGMAPWPMSRFGSQLSHGEGLCKGGRNRLKLLLPSKPSFTSHEKPVD